MKNILPLITIIGVLIFSCTENDNNNDINKNQGVFTFEHKLTLPGSPEAIYDAITGDISGWWDHSFSGSPMRLYIEAKPGGGFYEIFNESGDGVLHATVTFAQRGKLLRFVGPLGLAGTAINLVCTYNFKPAGKDSTELSLSVHGSGEVKQGTPELVDKVWQHFLFERFKPYIENGKHLKGKESLKQEKSKSIN